MSYRQAVLVIHGMGEQRPLGTLRSVVGALTASFEPENRRYYSRPTTLANSYEARRYIIPPVYDDDSPDRRPQTEVFEYHWAHMMTGNRLDDLLGTVRRVMLQWPWTVPGGILGLWLVLWGLILALGWSLIWGPLAEMRPSFSGVAEVLAVLLGTGLLGGAVTYLLTRVVPGWVTGSFVDVVRYLDTSPRSLRVRTEIRAGAVELLEELNDHYDRVIVVAHSLGSYIAYDAIRYLWGARRLRYEGQPPADPPDGGEVPDGLAKLEAAAIALLDADEPSPQLVAEYQRAQASLRFGLKDQRHDWHITDLVSLGSPMTMADQIYTTTREEFDAAVDRHEFPVCPPSEDHPPVRGDRAAQAEEGRPINYTHEWKGRRVLSDGAPFAVMRWTNLWFPTRALFFGDWFGGPLAPLFGRGVKDVAIERGRWTRLIPGYAHSLYYKEAAAEPKGQLGEAFTAALGLRFATTVDVTEEAAETTR